MQKHHSLRPTAAWSALFFSATAAAVFLATAASADAQYSLTVLHNNDGESRLLGVSDALSSYGNAARFKTLLDQTRDFYRSAGHGVVAIYAGDSFLAGAQFQASLDSGPVGARTFYDALAISRMGYDASILGNHEFDFGPEVLAEFIEDAQAAQPTTYLSANLEFAAEPSLQAHVAAGRIAASKIAVVPTAAGAKKVGIIGATTETLRFVASPGGVGVQPVADAVNVEIALLQGAGVDAIVLGSHLQSVDADNDLVALLNPGIDLIIAGGGDDLLTHPAALKPSDVHGPGAPASVVETGLIPGQAPAVLGGSLTGVANSYPLLSTVRDAGGNAVPLVTTGGNYGYLGRVTLEFDAGGNLTAIDGSSGPQRVAGLTVDPVHGVAEDPVVVVESLEPVRSFVNGLQSTVIARTSTRLLHGGSSTIRSRETNLGNLVADGILHAAQQQAADFGVDKPTIAVVNGGGIRAAIEAGDVSQLSTFSVSPFGNFVSIVEDVRLADLKLLLENAYSRTADGLAGPGVQPVGSNGRFAHLAGMEVVYNIQAPGYAFDASGAATATPRRIVDMKIGGVAYLQEGQWLVDPRNTTVDVATLDFLARGGDQYFRTAIGGSSTYLSQIYDFTAVGVTDQNALQQYLRFMAAGDVAFDVSSYQADYAIQQRIAGGRVSAVPEPAGWLTCVLAVVVPAGRLRRDANRSRR